MKNYLLLLISILLFSYLWIYSDQPPYSSPSNDVNKGYWPLLISIAEKWRSPDKAFFWDKEIAFGTSLYLTGQYPIFNPFNFTAWFLNNDQFFLFHLILPYSVGFLLFSYLLLNIFKLNFWISVFGGLFYMGIYFGKYVYVAQSPAQLWGAVLFPLMILVYFKIENELKYLLIGSIVAAQFLMEGVVQYPHLIIFWLLFIFINERNKIKKSILYLVAAIGLCSVQLIPTFYFVLTSPVRQEFYPINSFPLFGFNTPKSSFQETIYRGLFLFPSKSGILFLLLLIIIIFLIFKNKKFIEINKFNYRLFITSLIFFSLPTIFSFFPIMSFLRMFNFRYAFHIFDFTFTLILCAILNNIYLFFFLSLSDSDVS